MTHVCPVCWRTVHPTISGNICGHYDTTRQTVCPGSFHNIHITIRKAQTA